MSGEDWHGHIEELLNSKLDNQKKWLGEKLENHQEIIDLKISQINTNVSGMAKDIEEHETTIHGNGKVGLKTEVDRNTTFRGNANKVFWATISPLYAGVIALIFYMIRTSIAGTP